MSITVLLTVSSMERSCYRVETLTETVKAALSSKGQACFNWPLNLGGFVTVCLCQAELCNTGTITQFDRDGRYDSVNNVPLGSTSPVTPVSPVGPGSPVVGGAVSNVNVPSGSGGDVGTGGAVDVANGDKLSPGASGTSVKDSSLSPTGGSARPVRFAVSQIIVVQVAICAKLVLDAAT